MAKKQYDVILFGATGFTGRQAAQYFADNVGSTGLRWTIAGRNMDKLQAVKSQLGSAFADMQPIVADSFDFDSVTNMVKQTRVLLTTVGPYDLYGEPIVAACVRHNTDYVDITGENQFVRRIIDRYHVQAAQNGTRIIPFCGFDAVPSDIGTLMMVGHFRKQRKSTKQVKSFFQAKGGFNGGTVASAINLMRTGPMTALTDPIYLNPYDHASEDERAHSQDNPWPAFDDDLKRWTAPYFMAPVNSRVVRRSNALFAKAGYAYGDTFLYSERMLVGGTAAPVTAGIISTTMKSVRLMGQSGRILRAAYAMAPKGGTGPTEEQMDSGFFKCKLIARDEDDNIAFGEVSNQGDPGNRSTVLMLCESALTLALTPREKLPGGPRYGGVLTPATGLGPGLIIRLRDAGMTLSVGSEPT